jgi:hypothetical protein
MGITFSAAYLAAGLALVGIADEDRHTPLLVRVVAVASLCGVRAILLPLDAEPRCPE